MEIEADVPRDQSPPGGSAQGHLAGRPLRRSNPYLQCASTVLADGFARRRRRAYSGQHGWLQADARIAGLHIDL